MGDDGGDSDDSENVTAPKIQDHCVLIWEGTVQQRSFKNWKVTHARSEAEARKTLADRGAEHYWEMLARYRDPRWMSERVGGPRPAGAGPQYVLRLLSRTLRNDVSSISK